MVIGILIIGFILILSLVFVLFKIYLKLKHENYLLKNKLIEERSVNSNFTEELHALNEKIVNLEVFERMVMQSPNAIMMMDADGNILWVNQGFENMYEYNYKEFTGKLGSNIRRTSFNPKIIERLNLCATTKKPVRYEALNVTRTGKNIWTNTALLPLVDKKGNIVNLVTIDSDIHRRVVTSDVLIEQMEGLNSRIDELAKQFAVVSDETKSMFGTINETKEFIKQTDQIVQFIKEISDRTKILGINASIEASIAGPHGRGFRVIANEVVQVSNQALNSVTEIAELIQRVKQSFKQIQKEKKGSEEALFDYNKVITELKSQIVQMEYAIAEMKSLG